MKAVILKIVDKEAITLKADGMITKILNKNYSIGEEIYLKEKKYPSREWASLVAALLIFITIGTGTWVYATPDYEVSILGEGKEVDEILFEVNWLGKVVGVKYAQGDKYEELESKDMFLGEDIFDAMMLTFECIDDEIDYRTLEIATISHSLDHAKEKADIISERITNHDYSDAHDRYEYAINLRDEDMNPNNNKRENAEIKEEIIEIKHLCRHDKEEAETLGITPGKYNIIRNAMGNENVAKYVEQLRGELGEDEQLSKKIMEKYSESKKEQIKVNTTGNGNEASKEKETVEEKDNPSADAPGQLKEDQQIENDDEKREDIESKPKEESKINKSNNKTDNSIDKISQGNIKDNNQSDKSSKNNNKDDENQDKPTKEKQANNNKKRA